MPFPNEHAARLVDPEKFGKLRRENDKFGKGIHAIWGVKEDGTVELQAVRFDKERFTVAEAKAWLKEQGMKAILFEPAAGAGKSRKERVGKMGMGVGVTLGGLLGASLDKIVVLEPETAGAPTSTSPPTPAVTITATEPPVASIPAEESDGQFRKQVRLLKDSLSRNDVVLGVVYEPDTIDLQGDWADAETIERAAHDFLEDFRELNLMHEEPLSKSQASLVESFIAPATLVIGKDLVKKGAWMIGVKLKTDELKKAVKAGELNAFSLEGSAKVLENIDPPGTGGAR